LFHFKFPRNDYASHLKELEADCYLNTIIIRDKTHNDGKVFMENYLHTLVLDLEERIKEFDKDSSMVMLLWVLGYLRFEKIKADMRNKKRGLTKGVKVIQLLLKITYFLRSFLPNVLFQTSLLKAFGFNL